MRSEKWGKKIYKPGLIMVHVRYSESSKYEGMYEHFENSHQNVDIDIA